MLRHPLSYYLGKGEITIIGQNFILDGIDSQNYSVSIVNFERTEWKYTAGGGAEFGKDKPKRSPKYTLYDFDENAVLTTQIELVYEPDCTTADVIEIKDWLFGSFGYKKLVIPTDDLKDYYFNCIFKPNQDYMINGKLIGMILDLECDSPYAWQDISTRIIPTTNPFTHILNNTSTALGSTKPTVEFVLKGTNKNLSILNKANNIDFKWTNLNQTEKIIFDCDSGIIQSYLWATLPEPPHYTVNPISRLSCFNKSILKLAKGNNELVIFGTDGNTDIADYIDISYQRAVRIGGAIY